MNVGDNVDVLIWSDIEMHTSVIFPSLIAIRPLITKIIPARFLSHSSQPSAGRSRPKTKQAKAEQRWTSMFNLRPTMEEVKGEGSRVRGDSEEGLVREMEVKYEKGRPDLMKELPRIRVMLMQDLERGRKLGKGEEG